MRHDVLVVAAHPDDEILGMGGTIARHVRTGDTVTVLWVTDGSSGQYPDRPDIARRKDRDSEAALRTLGVHQWIRGGLPDMRLDSVPHVEVNHVVESAVERSRADTVYCVHPDVNRDHRAVFDSTAVATRPRPGGTVRSVLTYPTTSSIEWTPPAEATFSPTWFVDISDEIEMKVAALSCYETELRAWPHPRSRRALVAVGEAWGSTIGVECAEVFCVVRHIQRRGDPLA